MSSIKRKSTLFSLSSHRSLKTSISEPIEFRSLETTREHPRISKPLSTRKNSEDSGTLSNYSAESLSSSTFHTISHNHSKCITTLHSLSTKMFSSTGAFNNNNSRIPRSSHYGNISSFIDGSNSARKTQQQEIDELNTSCARISAPGEDLLLHLVENAIFMTFCLKEADRVSKRSTRYWDDLDIDEVLRA